MQEFLVVAAGTMAGILCSAAIFLALFNWMRRSVAPQRWMRTRRIAIQASFAAMLVVVAWMVEPFLVREYHDYQRRRESIREAANERTYCYGNKSEILQQATAPIKEGMLGWRMPREFEQMGNTTFSFRTPFGWLKVCRNYGIVSEAEYQQAVLQQAANQSAHDAPERESVEKEKRGLDESLRRFREKLVPKP